MKHWPIIASLIAIGVIANFLLPQFFTPPPSLAILSGSENRTLAPIIKSWSDENNVKVTLDYAGSVDISRELSKGADSRYDAVWPAHSLWIDLGDEQHVVIHRRSILTSPVVLALKRSIAQELDWEGRNDLTIEDIAAAAQAKSFRLAMTSATQSNSGASAYLGFLHALSGKPEPLTLAALDDPDLQEQIRGLLAQIDRSSGSSGWLKDMLVANPDRFDAMVNYEAMALEANQALIAAEQEPLYLIYPVNGIAVADSPLGLIDKGDPKTEEAFLALQAHLLSGKIQQSLIAQGRRAGLVDVTNSELIRRSLPIWNSAFGTDLSREITPVPTPEAEVIQKALTLYQTDLRKPSLTVWVLDVSGSMEGKPLNQLKTAMRMLFDPNQVAELLLQPAPKDITIILPFNADIQEPITITGNSSAELAKARVFITALEADGGTDIYYALYKALQAIEPYLDQDILESHLPAIVVMTDGRSETGNREPLFNWMQGNPYSLDIPIHSIAFGQADLNQLTELTQTTIGRLFSASDNLAQSLRSAKGYN